jgi:retron-type reverse transcriptase
MEMGVPHNIVKRLYYINSCAVTVKPPYRLNEYESTIKKLVHKQDFEGVINAPRPISYMYRLRGVPQGAPTSPVLANIGLHNSILDRPGLKTIMYADDGIYYGDINQPVITPNSGIVSANIHFNLNKSG